jgi:hypothetical protein
MSKVMSRPFYGVDGNLLVEDLEYSRERVESILNGTFKAVYLIENIFPGVMYRRYPQLLDEAKKRRHRKAYKAHLKARLALRQSDRY